MKGIIRILVIGLCIMLCLLVSIFACARYGWRLFGFSACITPDGIFAKEIIMEEGLVHLKGDTSHSAPSYIGYIAKEEKGNLYIGLKYNMLFGFSQRIGAFDMQVKCDTASIRKIYFKNAKEEQLIWERASDDLSEYVIIAPTEN